jgi:hypothetical protein
VRRALRVLSRSARAPARAATSDVRAADVVELLAWNGVTGVV